MRDHDEISCETHAMSEIDSKSTFFMNFVGRRGTAVNDRMITSKWLADEFPKKALVNHWGVWKKLLAKHSIACFFT